MLADIGIQNILLGMLVIMAFTWVGSKLWVKGSGKKELGLRVLAKLMDAIGSLIAFRIWRPSSFQHPSEMLLWLALAVPFGYLGTSLGMKKREERMNRQ